MGSQIQVFNMSTSIRGKIGGTITTVFNSVFFTIELLFLTGTCILYVYADKSFVQRELVTRLYRKDLWKTFRRTSELKDHALIAVAIQSFLLILSLLMIFGIR